MIRLRCMSLALFVLTILFIPASAFAQDGPIEKTYCTYALGYESVEAMKLDLLNNAKRLAVSEFFGEFITASTAVENSVVTSDQIQASSLGFVRIAGDAAYYNGSSFAEVCVLIRAFVTQEDLKLVEPVNIKKRVCLAREGLAADELASLVKEEVVIEALQDYDRRLAAMQREQVLQLMQRLTYHESGFLDGTTTYCAEVEGQVTPIEVLAFVTQDELVEPNTPSAATITPNVATEDATSTGQAAPLPQVPELAPRPDDLVTPTNPVLGGTIERDTLLLAEHGPYIVNEYLTVAEGVTLIIDAGAIIKLAENMVIGVNGTLRSEGTAANPVVFTSIKNDNVGGDTNGDRSSTQPAAGDWGQIYFSPTSQSSFLEYTHIEYGGLHQDLGSRKGNTWYYVQPSRDEVVNWTGSIILSSASPTIRNSTIRNGLHAAISADVYSFPVVVGNTFTANRINGIRIWGGVLDPNILTTYRWSNTDAIYVLDDNHYVTIGNKATLEIAPGVTVKMGANTLLGVNGALRVLGEAEHPVVFTSLKDDSIGGDTNGDRTSTQPAAGDWGQIYYSPTSVSDESLIQYAHIEYGGLHQDLGSRKGNTWYYTQPSRDQVIDWTGSIILSNASPTIRNSTIRNGLHAAISANVYSFPIVTGNTFAGNRINGMGVLGGVLEPNMLTTYRWSNTDVIYVLDDNHYVTIGNKATLEIAPDVTVKMGRNTVLGVDGALQIQGEADRPVTFTSLNDDSVGGDTNGDRTSTQPSAGDWGQIYFSPLSVSDESFIQHAVIAYGGLHQDLGSRKGNTWYYMQPSRDQVIDWTGSIVLSSTSPTIRNTTIAASLVGIHLYGTASPTLVDVEYSDIVREIEAE